MDPVIETCVRYGHHHNPIIAHEFKGQSDAWWQTLASDSRIGKLLVQSYQQMMGEEFERAAYEAHRASAKYNGVAGRATRAVMSVERCGCPDFVEQDDTTELVQMVSGSVAWPKGCSGDDSIHGIYYSTDMSACPYASVWRDIWLHVTDVYADIGLAWTPAKSGSGHIRISWEKLGGSTIGLATLPPPGTCNFNGFLKLDTEYMRNASSEVRIQQVTRVAVHEAAHNQGIGHIANDPIQSPVVQTGPWDGKLRGTALGDQLIRRFGGRPVQNPNRNGSTPVPPVPPKAESVVVTGRLQVRVDGVDRGEFIVVPVPL